MSLREANRNQAFYRLMTLMSAQSLADWDAINQSHHFDTVTWDKIDQLRPSAFDIDPAGMAAAHQRTEDRIKAAMDEASHAAEAAVAVQSPRK
jgi:hypothetical protein